MQHGLSLGRHKTERVDTELQCTTIPLVDIDEIARTILQAAAFRHLYRELADDQDDVTLRPVSV